VPGRWHTAVDIGTRIFKDFVVGHLGDLAARAPFDGPLRGVVRDGTDVPAGVKLLEVDPRGRQSSWTGIDDSARSIAKAAMEAISIHEASVTGKARSTLYLVK
jgi:xanthine dehydrogenase accessory factor